MPSKSTEPITVRIPKNLLADLDRLIEWSQHSRPEGPYTRSSVIAKAVRDFLAHRERARRRRGRADA